MSGLSQRMTTKKVKNPQNCLAKNGAIVEYKIIRNHKKPDWEGYDGNIGGDGNTKIFFIKKKDVGFSIGYVVFNNGKYGEVETTETFNYDDAFETQKDARSKLKSLWVLEML